jgi:hypothetical protein
VTFEGSGYLLSTGRRFYANRGLLSPGEGASDGGRLFYGYDGEAGITLPEPADWTTLTAAEIDQRDLDSRFTADERREIAEYMIARWRYWAEHP